MTDLPSGWALATLDDLQANEPRAVTDGPFGSNLSSAHYTASGARVIRLQNIGDGRFVDERAYISMEHFDKLKAHEVRAGDLVVASLGQSLPRVCIVPELDAPAIVKADCIRVRLHPSIDARWLLYTLSSPAVRVYASSRVRGVGRPRLGLGELRQISIPVPPIAEQRRILAALEGLLSGLSAAVDSAKRARLRLRRLRSRWLLELTKEVSLVSRGVTQMSIGEMATLLRNGMFVSRPGVDPDGVPILRIGAVRPLALNTSDIRFTGKEPDELNGAGYLLNEGDILFTRYNGNPEYVGACAVVPADGARLAYPDKLIRVVVDPRIANPNYVAMACSVGRGREQIRSAIKTTAGQAGISGRELKAVTIALPSIDEQNHRVEQYQRVDRLLNRLSVDLERAESNAVRLLGSLLGQAFAGQLVPQDPNDEPASELLARIKAERAASIPKQRTRSRRTTKELPAPPTRVTGDDYQQEALPL
ncbi:restriction endonuclease subunit S [Micromonospora rubida]|uniref:Restriction endonuclease subunit S n=1 Tax=Micromonospora rubida TaxID=2697657 RepID=A0ABW7SPM2_9ACTN